MAQRKPKRPTSSKRAAASPWRRRPMGKFRGTSRVMRLAVKAEKEASH
jgi:hypothetical protein